MKKIISTVLSLAMISAFAVPAMAAENTKEIQLPSYQENDVFYVPIGNAQYVDFGDGNLVPVSDIPTFNTQAEADAYVAEISAAINSAPTEERIELDTENALLSSYSYDTVVATKAVSLGNVKLHVAYTTSGANHTGSVTQHSAYTEMSGFTYGFDWEENSCYTTLQSSGKDIDAYANGTLKYYLLVNTNLEIYRASVTLSGTAWAIH